MKRLFSDTGAAARICIGIALVVLTCAICSIAIAGPLTPGNLLVSTENFGGPADTVLEYTVGGVQLQNFPVPYPGGRPGTEDVRDLYVDSRGNVQIYNGTFTPFLTTLNPTASSFQHNSAAGLSSVANISFGGITTLGNFGYLTDMNTGGGTPNGIVRFDLTNFTFTRFANGSDYGDITLGGDGFLYAIRNPGGGVNASSIDVFDPATLALSRTITLPAPIVTADVRGIAVDSVGQLYAAAWDGKIYQLSPNGGILNQRPSGTSNLMDIDLDDTGRLVVGGRFGDVILTTTSLTSQTSFISAGANPIHVAWTVPLSVPEPGMMAMIGAIGLMGAVRRSRRRSQPVV